MHRHLETFPDALEGFLKQMLDDVPNFHRGHSAMIFKIAIEPTGHSH
jgi:hypothetical protein